jgi:opacity protein-like surface antigen
MDRRSTAAATIALLLCASAARAADQGSLADKGWYIGAGAGRFHFHGFDDSCSTSSNTCSVSFTESGNTEKVLVGYQFVRYVAIELDHVWLGKITRTETDNSSGAVRRSATSKTRGYTFDVVGTLPIGSRLGFQGRFGTSYWHSQTSETGPGFANSDVDYGFGYQFGVGVKYDLHKNWVLRAEIRKFTVASGDLVTATMWPPLYLASASVVFRFR